MIEITYFGLKMQVVYRTSLAIPKQRELQGVYVDGFNIKDILNEMAIAEIEEIANAVKTNQRHDL